MRRATMIFLTLTFGGCATVPRGPSDAEVRALLETRVEHLASDVMQARTAAFAAEFTPDGEMVVRNVTDPAGTVSVDLKGRAAIESFLDQEGPPTYFSMRVAKFSRSGAEAQQSGSWLLGEQTGTFSLDWRESAAGTWLVTRGRFIGG